MAEALRSNVNVLWPDETPRRACVVCDFGVAGRLCGHPEVAGRIHRTDTDQARALGGACGPDARFLTINGVAI